MTTVPQHLLSEDRPEYERILDEALLSAPARPELASMGQRLSPEQLRTMALNASGLITAAAAPEYEHYVKIRQEWRRPAVPPLPAAPPPESLLAGRGWLPTASLGRRIRASVLSGGPGHGRQSGTVTRQSWAGMSFGRRVLASVLGLRVRPSLPPPLRGSSNAAHSGSPAQPPSPAADKSTARLAATLGEVAESAGAGLIAVVAVLAPVLAGTAALIFLVIGYLLSFLDPEPAYAQDALGTGWVLGAVTAVSVLASAIGLLVTAMRNGSLEQTAPLSLSEEVARAKEVWQEALLERGILPFLREALAEPVVASVGTRSDPHARSLLSADHAWFTNPDFGGPEHQPG
ncbi:hypothetical protein ABT040_45415 [Streptomyces sp. NPDC002688]|uniref:hypothetical protein n=1 Tax=Streptomyces sp. NPDC002688 TaxID=3154423 RepID=UPI0033244445